MAASATSVAPPTGGPVTPPSEPPDPSVSIFRDTYSLEWLFDPERCYDHLPLEEQLKMYKHRDLAQVKFFKVACKIFGAPRTRQRVIIAPPMCKKGQEQEERYQTSPVPMNSKLNPKKPQQKLSEEEPKVYEDPVTAHKDWVSRRKAFRNSLENMGLNEDWLTRKPNKTPLEQRVLRRMLEEKYPHVPSPPPREDTPLEPILPGEPPVVRRPSPLAIRVIEKLLREKQMRLIDLFACVDKDKNWKVSREEFRQAIREADIPIDEVLLEDLIHTLDQNLNDQLDYRELAKGMELWKLEKRESKRKVLASDEMSTCPKTYSRLSGFESPEKDPGNDGIGTAPSKSRSTPTSGVYQERKGSANRVRSALSTISSGSSQYLEPPEPDLRQEQMILASEEEMLERRKRDKAVLRMVGKKSRSNSEEEEAPGMIKTGDPYVDAHCQPSTLSGETGELVNRFRQLKFKEYNDICQLCREKNMPFTEEVLRKVLLFPPDKPHSELKKQICQPGELLLQSNFAKPQKRPKSPLLAQRKSNAKVSKSGSKTKPRADPNGGYSDYRDEAYSGQDGYSYSRSTRKGDRTTSRDTRKLKASRGASGSARVDPRSAYPSRDAVSRDRGKMNLSTGRAVIGRQVNCWMTFEEYDKLTSHLATRYTQIHGRTSDNAFWPGHLLDKMRLCMPDSEPKSSSVFTSVKSSHHRTYPGYNNNIQTWPVNPKGYIQYGLVDPYANKYI